MQSKKDRSQDELFVNGSLERLIPADHLFRRVNVVLELDWLHEAVSDCYSQEMGRPGIDPESALRLMLAGFFEGIVHDRKLMRRAQTDIAFRWFAGFRLDEDLPHHSSLTRIRQRWGAQRFKQIFIKTVEACVTAGLVGGKTVHIDATLIRADVSWESLTTEHINQLDALNEPDDTQTPPKERKNKAQVKKKKSSTTDPDASMATSRKDQRLEPTYKQHTASDDLNGVIVDVSLDTGATSEGRQLLQQVGRIENNTGIAIQTVTADASYAHSGNYAALEERGINAVIPPQPSPRNPRCIPLSRFKYDPHHNIVKCPNGKILERKGRNESPGGWRYAARSADCQQCPLRAHCFSQGALQKTVVITDGYEALMRARRRKAKGWDAETKEAYSRHRWRVEGAHGEAKTQHGLRRAVRRGLENVAIQVYLCAAVMNLKRLANSVAKGRIKTKTLPGAIWLFIKRITPKKWLLRKAIGLAA